MAIYDYLPKYYQIEANNLKGLQPGFVVAQMPVSAVAANTVFAQVGKNVLGASGTELSNKIANGHIVTLKAEGIVDADATSPLFIVYNDPLLTIHDNAAFYATDLREERLRLVELIPGDEWMSDMDLLAGENNPLAGRIIEITENAATKTIYDSDDWFAMKHLPDGTPAHHYVFIK